jgi:hypothetical protein
MLRGKLLLLVVVLVGLEGELGDAASELDGIFKMGMLPAPTIASPYKPILELVFRICIIHINNH